MAFCCNNNESKECRCLSSQMILAVAFINETFFFEFLSFSSNSLNFLVTIKHLRLLSHRCWIHFSFFSFLCRYILLYFCSNECKNAHKPQRFYRAESTFCFYSPESVFHSTVCYSKSDGGEENLFIGCACFSHSLVRAKRKYCKRVEWQWHFLYISFVCKIFAR